MQKIINIEVTINEEAEAISIVDVKLSESMDFVKFLNILTAMTEELTEGIENHNKICPAECHDETCPAHIFAREVRKGILEAREKANKCK